ncbi:MAG TPA: HAMP domain-containing sensor histidine kinase [Candidatus Acidoferrales bacterium]|nr:HAMP domain-containing sensor histidine kinase [Candidatus Acidoferrales bacterium]
MHSLRGRLGITYGLITAVAAILIILAAAELAFRIETHPITRAVEVSAARARMIVVAHPRMPTEELIKRIVANAPVTEAIVVGPAPGDSPDRFARTIREQGTTQLEPNLGGKLKAALGLPVEAVDFRGTGVLVLTDSQYADVIVYKYAKLAGGAILLALIGSFFVGRWIANHAVSPLEEVTAELRRFATGDFTPRALKISDHDELGELTDAYNHAAAQVAAAFRERARVEEQMRRFIADAGHELRTPLTAISGFHQLLEQGGYDDTTIRRKASTAMAKETRRMRLLVEQLITCAKLSPDKAAHPSRIDLVEVTRDAVTRVQASRPGNVIFRSSGRAMVTADRLELDAALGNLIDNALKYGRGSDVHVDVGVQDDSAVVRVADGGPGVPQSDRERIFERFYRGDYGGTIEGSGLGLAIASMAAERSGGRVVLERAEPGHTVFALIVPTEVESSEFSKA